MLKQMAITKSTKLGVYFILTQKTVFRWATIPLAGLLCPPRKKFTLKVMVVTIAQMPATLLKAIMDDEITFRRPKSQSSNYHW